MNWLTKILETYQKGKIYDLLQQASKDLDRLNNSLIAENENLNNNLTLCKQAKFNYAQEIEELKEEKSPIDIYLSKKYSIVRNKAYAQKREYDVFINQMITPNSFEVLKFKKQTTHTNLYTRVAKLGDRLARHTTWVNEQKLYDSGDRYLYPEETLTIMKKKCDCEDVTFTMASFEPEFIGAGYGYYHKGNSKFGHAYPVFLYNDKLFIVETTGNRVEIVPYEDKRYETFFIVTKDKTYKVKSGVEFGRLAEW